MCGLLHELGLAETDARRQLGARTEQALGDGRAALGRHGDDAISQLEQLDVAPFDLVVVNLYPFAATVASGALDAYGVTHDGKGACKLGHIAF